MQIKQNSKHKNAEFNNRPILAGEDLTQKNPLERERRLKIHREQRRKRRQQQTISRKIWAKIAVTKHVLLPYEFIPYRFMHQSTPAAPSFPPGGATAGHLQILRCQGAGHLPTPSFWHARGSLLEYNYTEDFTGKQADWFVCQGRETLKRFVKVCSRFYACISSLLIKPELYSETRKLSTWINVFLVIESSFSWYYLKNILSYLIYRFSQG